MKKGRFDQASVYVLNEDSEVVEQIMGEDGFNVNLFDQVISDQASRALNGNELE